MRQRNEDLGRAYKEKSRKLLQTQELYDRAKREAELRQNLIGSAKTRIEVSTPRTSARGMLMGCRRATQSIPLPTEEALSHHTVCDTPRAMSRPWRKVLLPDGEQSVCPR